MCGIVGIVSQKINKDLILDVLNSLTTLEYRGYDSAGISYYNQQEKSVNTVKKTGSIDNLKAEVKANHLQQSTNIAIAHSRWATHGKVTINNAHPHNSSDNTISIVHNGIIENYQDLRQKLQNKGFVFNSQTDSEVIAHLLDDCLKQQPTIDLKKALQQTCKQLQGAFAILVMSQKKPDELFLACLNSPLVIGKSDSKNYVASDVVAIAGYCKKVMYLTDGTVAQVSSKSVDLFTFDNIPIKNNFSKLELQANQILKDGYPTFMEKEINQQPTAVYNTLNYHIQKNDKNIINNIGKSIDLKNIKNIHFISCGTSYNASLVAKYWFEENTNISCSCEVASEYRYRKQPVHKNTVFVCLSQSGETADTIASIKKAKEQGYKNIIAICNVENSTISRLVDYAFITKAGVEVSVASTKAFVSQLVVLLVIMAKHMLLNNDDKKSEKILQSIYQVPELLKQILALQDDIKNAASIIYKQQNVIFLGRNIQYPIMIEASLKLCEISYINCVALPAGELKHGPLALVNEQIPIIANICNNKLTPKVLSNLEEVNARGGNIILFADKQLDIKLNENTKIIKMPTVNDITSPFVYACAMQLLAYHTAVLKGNNVDKPKNLAKSVTVE